MSKIEKIRDQLSAYIDGELTSAQSHRVEEAVAADTELAAELAALRAVRELVGSLPAARAPGDLLDSVMQQAERGHLVDSSPQPSSHSHGAWRWVRRLGVAAVLAIAACIGVAIVSQVWNAGPEQIPLASHNAAKPAATIARVDGDEKASKAGEFLGEKHQNKAGRVSVPSDFGITLASAVVDIYTPDLAAAQGRVELVLASNSTEPAVLNVDGSITPPARPMGKSRGRGASFHSNWKSTTQVQYEIYATEEQIDNIRKELGPVIAMQNVSQARGVEVVTNRPHKDRDAITYGSWFRDKNLRNSRKGKGGSSGLPYRLDKTVVSETDRSGRAPKETGGFSKVVNAGIVSKGEAREAESRPAATVSSPKARRFTVQAGNEVIEQPDFARSVLIARGPKPTTSPSRAVRGNAESNDSVLIKDNDNDGAPAVDGKDDAKKDLPESMPTGRQDGSHLFAGLLRKLFEIETGADKDMTGGSIATSRPAGTVNLKLEGQRLGGRKKLQQAVLPPEDRSRGLGVTERPAPLRQGLTSNIWAQEMQLKTASQAVTNVKRLVITLNYRQAAGDAYMPRAKASPSSRASQSQAPETKSQE